MDCKNNEISIEYIFIESMGQGNEYVVLFLFPSPHIKVNSFWSALLMKIEKNKLVRSSASSQIQEAILICF